jgi:hypothetical protein
MVRWVILTLVFSGCITPDTESDEGYAEEVEEIDDGGCKSVSEEPISQCRAEHACGKNSAAFRIGAALSAFGQNGSNRAVENLNDCIFNNLSAQRAAAGVPDKSVICDSRVTGQNTVRTRCH